MNDIFGKYFESINDAKTVVSVGHVIAVHDLVIESIGPQAVIGEICKIFVGNESHQNQKKQILVEVTALNADKVTLMPYDEVDGIEIGAEVHSTGCFASVAVGQNLLGRTVDGLGKPCDEKGPIIPETFYSALANAPNPITRPRITQRIATGIRAIDGILTLGAGQRIGIMAGSGVGKSSLLSMIARGTSADVNVIALIGERGREVNDFIERDLGEEGLKKSVLVVATSDQKPLMRLRGAYTATAIAEYFRDKGLSVMLMFDSITRFAQAHQEIGLANGEVPMKGGFPASVFAILPRLLERAGTSSKGSITGIYTVLVDGDDFDEPIADKTRAILDGHIVLTRALFEKRHYPPIDVLKSISRLSDEIAGEKLLSLAGKLSQDLALYRDNEDLIKVGAYQSGIDSKIDSAIDKHEVIQNFLRQKKFEKSTFPETIAELEKIYPAENQNKTKSFAEMYNIFQ